jgi:hypothetical protein
MIIKAGYEASAGCQYVYKWSPNSRQADFQFSDPAAGKGQHRYYVRGEQKNGELAWPSPIWVKY